MIKGIPENATDHETAIPPYWVPRAPYDGNTQAKTLTCKGGDNYHPSGTRPYTSRELASLQTFPLRHSFAGARGVTATKQQIGNAVPPVFARTLFRHIIQSLKEMDGVA
jgi:DNA (cytosine-5)-methyltransferase 1